MMQALELLWLAKRQTHTSNSEETKPAPIPIFELCLGKQSQSISQSVSRRFYQIEKTLKFNSNLFEGFRIDLKTVLGLAMLNQQGLIF